MLDQLYLLTNKIKKNIGEYRLQRLTYLEKLYKKLDKKFNWSKMQHLSKKDIRREVEACYGELGRGGYTKSGMINPKGVVI